MNKKINETRFILYFLKILFSFFHQFIQIITIINKIKIVKIDFLIINKTILHKKILFTIKS